jgi:glycosyltransferase involved in cell wall biosynthesis
VIATTESPLPQLLAGGGIFVAPGDHEALRSAMVSMMTGEPARAAMGIVARERAGALQWQQTADGVLKVLEEAAA